MTRPYPIVSILLILSLQLVAQPRKKGWNTRLDLSWIHDSNLYEQVDSASAGSAGRFWIQTGHRGLLSRRVGYAFNYQGGVEAYAGFPSQDRTIHHLRVGLYWGVAPRLRLGFSGGARLKHYFNDPLQYALFQIAPYLSYRLSPAWTARLQAHLASIDFNGQRFDNRSEQIGLCLDFTPIPELSMSFQARAGQIHYQRYSLNLCEETFEYNLWQYSPYRQKDACLTLSHQIEFYGWALLRFETAWQRVRSNSYGYSYSRPELKFMAAKSFRFFLLRLYWSQLWKIYRDPLNPIILISPDSENDETSHLLLDISRDMGQNHTLRLRIGWYQSESPFRNLFYSKTLLSAGYTFRF